MTITVIETSTAERRQETIQLFHKIKPLLDKGYNFKQALNEACNIEVYNYKNGWFKDLIDYAKKQGYDYHEYKWRRGH